jgi:anti-sigma-K factor RskA
MTHAEMDELYELFALGALEPELTSEIHEHLRDQCSYCLEHISDASRLSAALAGIAEQRQPPDSLRDRVLASVAPVRRSRNWMPVVAGLAAACIALLVFSLWSGRQAASMRDQLAALRGERDQLRAALEIMGRSETRTVQFGRTEDVPHGRVFVNPRSGLVFVGAQLPQLASDRTFELWLIPRAGAPRPAGLFRPNVAGRSVNVSSIPVDASETKAVAVSVEPREGSSAPTTTPILVVPLE